MPIGLRVCPIDEITGRDVVDAARLWHVDQDRAAALVTDCAATIASTVRDVCTPDVPDTLGPAVEAACDRLSRL